MMDDDANWYGPDVATFGDRVAASRERADMTQAVLAKRLGVRLATLRSWEDDLSEPRANRLSMLAGLLNVSMMWLINGEGEGISAPDTPADNNSDMAGIVAELREVRTELLQKAAQIGRLEKRLRGVVQETTNV